MPQRLAAAVHSITASHIGLRHLRHQTLPEWNICGTEHVWSIQSSTDTTLYPSAAHLSTLLGTTLVYTGVHNTKLLTDKHYTLFAFQNRAAEADLAHSQAGSSHALLGEVEHEALHQPQRPLLTCPTLLVLLGSSYQTS